MMSIRFTLGAIFLISSQSALSALPGETVSSYCGKNDNETPVSRYVFELYYGNSPDGAMTSDFPFEQIYGRLYSKFNPRYMKNYHEGEMDLFVCNKPKDKDKTFLLCRNWAKTRFHAQYVKIEDEENPKAFLYDQQSSSPSQVLGPESSIPIKLSAEIGRCLKAKKD
jgi:hypothetical protein